ncbi:MAG: ATP-binding protein [Spirochaetes bacterium]|nr:ATP-binding protein [Spirochaetota bacterium]
MKITLRTKVNGAILVTFLLIVILFNLIYVPFLQREFDRNLSEVYDYLKIIVEMENDVLVNEIFARHDRALRIHVEDMLKINKILTISLFKASGNLIISDGIKAETEDLKKSQQYQVRNGQYHYRVKWVDKDAICFLKELSLLDEKFGYIKIYFSIEHLNNQQSENRRIYFGLLLTILITMLIMLNIILSNTIIRPIHNLRDIMSSFKPDKQIKMLKLKREDEIGDLINTFNKMSQNLSDNYRDLSYSKEEIEKKNLELSNYQQHLKKLVDERTTKLDEANKRILLQEKLTWFGKMITGIAHELQNPLNFVNNFSEISIDLKKELMETIGEHNDLINEELLEEIKILLDQIENTLDKINLHGQRAGKIIQSMVLHSNEINTDYSHQDINDLLNTSLEFATLNLPPNEMMRKIQYIKKFDEKLPLINVIPRDFIHAIVNIINNSTYAVLEKGSRLQAEGFFDYQPKIIITSTYAGSIVQIVIEDNGTGIASQNLGKIKEPFFTTKPSGIGAGLGLTLANDIISNQHKGRIDLESKEGEFTKVVINIPVQEYHKNKAS